MGPVAFVIKINMLPSVIEQVVGNEDVVVDGDTILFMDDSSNIGTDRPPFLRRSEEE